MKTLTILFLSLMAVSLQAADRTTPREIETPYPTISNLAVEWQIDGDDNLDSTCEIEVRKAGEVTWRDAMPLRRVPAGASQGTNPIVSWTNRLSGSVFDLEPGTEYQIALKLRDPDGGEGIQITGSGNVIRHNRVSGFRDCLSHVEGNYTSEPFDHSLVQNNLFIGGKVPDIQFGGFSPGRGRAADVQKFGENCRIDYNAYATHGTPFKGKFRNWTFNKLPGTDFEPHGVQLGMDVLAVMTFPEDPTQVYLSPDLRPRKDSAVVDAAIRIPNVNESFAGQQPDIGAYEMGQVLPIYGPRQ